MGQSHGQSNRPKPTPPYVFGRDAHVGELRCGAQGRWEVVAWGPWVAAAGRCTWAWAPLVG